MMTTGQLSGIDATCQLINNENDNDNNNNNNWNKMNTSLISTSLFALFFVSPKLSTQEQ